MQIHCHPERSEGSVELGREMLRCAQQDRAVTHTDSWINLLNCIIGPRWIFRSPDEYVKQHHCIRPGSRCVFFYSQCGDLKFFYCLLDVTNTYSSTFYTIDT
jgi:hypothetical protein